LSFHDPIADRPAEPDPDPRREAAHTAPPPPACAPPHDAAGLLESAPVALVLLDDAGRLRWHNRAATALLGACLDAARRDPQPLVSVLGLPDLAALALTDGPVHATALDSWLTVRASARPDGCTLLSLTDANPLQALQAEMRRQHELMDLVQEVGRLGVWERDVRTLQGRWDRHVFRFWGLGEGEATPDFPNASSAIEPEDREAVEARFRDSLRQPGVYSHRYRVRRPDGGVTHLHSQWSVQAGDDGLPARVVGVMMDDTEVVTQAQARLAMASQLSLAEELGGLVLWRHDLAEDRMHLNRAGWGVLGLAPRPEGLPMAEMRETVHPDDLSRVLDSAKLALATDQPTDMQARYRRHDGKWRHLMTRRVLQRDADGRPLAFLGVALDVTASAEARQRAQLLVDRFDLAARAANIGYWSRDARSGHIYWNAEMRRLHGLAPAEAPPTLEQWIQDFVHPNEREAAAAGFRQWLRGPDPQSQTQLRIVRRDGETRHLMLWSHHDGDGDPPVQFGIVVDVSDRRQADLALRRAEQRAALAARGAGLGTWELDLRSGETYWDEQMWRLRGLTPEPQPPNAERMLGYVHPDDRAATGQQLDDKLHTPEVIESRFRVVWPDGSLRWLASRSAPVLDAEGQPHRRIGVNWDITAERRADEDRRDREAAERANRAKSEFIARMSHELRTPLNALLAFTRLMQVEDGPGGAGGPVGDDGRRQRLGHMHAAGQHLLSLIDDVLDLASLDAGELRVDRVAVRLQPLADAAWTMLEPLRRQQAVTVTQTLDPRLAVRGDATRLQQVLINLLSNGLKYNRRGGHLQLRAAREGAWVHLGIADTGLGLTDAQRRRLFEPFNRLGAERRGIEGTGIGLAIVKALVERMGGTIAVHSRIGQGTQVQLRLPAAEVDDVPAAPAPSSPPRPAMSRSTEVGDTAAVPLRRLLYIEDNPVNTLIVREALRLRPQLQLLDAVDGASGLALARRERPDLVMLDMQLPDIDGLEVLRRLRADPLTATLPCVAVSANVLPADISAARAAGAADYWTKPLDIDRFLAAMDHWLGPGRPGDPAPAPAPG